MAKFSEPLPEAAVALVIFDSILIPVHEKPFIDYPQQLNPSQKEGLFRMKLSSVPLFGNYCKKVSQSPFELTRTERKQILKMLWKEELKHAHPADLLKGRDFSLRDDHADTIVDQEYFSHYCEKV